MTTKNQHTPGPWVLCDVHYVQKDFDGGIIARVHGSNAECQANARLITTSPELLEALQAVTKELDTWHNWQLAVNETYPKSDGSIHVRNVLLKANTAIMKATNL